MLVFLKFAYKTECKEKSQTNQTILFTRPRISFIGHNRFFFFHIPVKLVFLLAANLSCSLTIFFFVVVIQDFLSKVYSMLFPFQEEELLNYKSRSAISRCFTVHCIMIAFYFILFPPQLSLNVSVTTQDFLFTSLCGRSSTDH